MITQSRRSLKRYNDFLNISFCFALVQTIIRKFVLLDSIVPDGYYRPSTEHTTFKTGYVDLIGNHPLHVSYFSFCAAVYKGRLREARGEKEN
jgi:hypothetical protein